jgi:cysteinyl-tRNA synthetase
MTKTAVTTLVALMAAVPAARAQAPQSGVDPQSRTKNLAAYAELLRSDVRAQKVAIITQLMEFSESDAKAFWPIYRDYDAEITKLSDERVALIEDYAKNYEKMTDEVADRLASKAIDLEDRRRATTAKCYDNVKKALGAKTAMRFLQVEHQLMLLIDLQIASSLPIVR